MKNTKANVVKLLKALSKQSMDLACIFTDEKARTRKMAESCAYDCAIWLLTDQEFFDKICKAMEVGAD